MTTLDSLKKKRDTLINEYRSVSEKISSCNNMGRFEWLLGKRESVQRGLEKVDQDIKCFGMESKTPKPRSDKQKGGKSKAGKSKRRQSPSTKQSDRFYLIREWRELRYKALENNGGRCEACGASAKDGVQLHVDHIKPRSKFPHLQLSLDNLQILCADCNIGKSNIYSTDWRWLEETP